MDRYYSTDGMDVYLVLQHTAYADSYETRMLQRNSIRGLLPFDLISIDGERIPCYNVSRRKEFGVASASGLEPRTILRLLQALFEVMDQMGAYLLSGNNLMLQEDSIFCDEKQEHFYFVYLPGYQTGVRGQMQELMDACIFRMQHADREQAEQVYQVYQMISENHADIKMLREEVGRRIAAQKEDENEDAEAADAWKRQQRLDEAFREVGPEKDIPETGGRYGLYKKLLLAAMVVTVLCGVGWGLVQYRNYRELRQPRPLMIVCMFFAAELFAYVELDKKSPADADGKSYKKAFDMEDEKESAEVMGDADGASDGSRDETADTVMLAAETVEYGLVPIADAGNHCPDGCQLLHLPYAQTTIGRGKKADCHLTDSSVSRLHARLEWTGQGYVMEDMNSTNGTFVNGYPLRPYFQVALMTGDQIAFGKKQYVLQIAEEENRYEEKQYVEEK